MSNKTDYEYFFGYFGSIVDYENIIELLFCINYLKTNLHINLTGIIIGKGQCENNVKNYIIPNGFQNFRSMFKEIGENRIED